MTRIARFNSGDAPAITFELFGNWQRQLFKTSVLAVDIRLSAREGQRVAGEKLSRKVKSHLRNQDLRPWEQLSDSRKRRKSKNKDLVLIHEEHYYNNIKAWSKRNTYYVGVKRGVTNEKGIEVARIAAIHEDKSINNSGPDRELWGPSIEEMGGPGGIRKMILKRIAAKLIMRGWKVTSLGGIRV